MYLSVWNTCCHVNKRAAAYSHHGLSSNACEESFQEAELMDSDEVLGYDSSPAVTRLTRYDNVRVQTSRNW